MNPKMNAVFLLPTLCLACGGGPELEGTYTSQSTWDLSAPFGPDGIGGSVSDIIIEGVVESVVPGFLQDEAIDVASALIKPPIIAAVESQLPPELRKDGEVLVGLRTAFSAVDVTTELKIDNKFRGTETMQGFVFPRPGGGAPLVLDEIDWLSGVQVAGQVKGDEDDDGIYKLEPYAMNVELGGLVLRVASEVFDDPTYAQIAALRDILNCTVIADDIVNQDGSIELRVAGQSFDVSRSTFQSVCELALEEQLGDFALLLTSVNAGVELQGPVLISDTDGDMFIDTIKSQSDFEGRITLLPGPIEPRIGVDFEAKRSSPIPLLTE